MQTQGTRGNTGSPSGDRSRDQLATRESQAGPSGVTERLAVLMKPGNAGGGKGPQLKGNARSNEGRGIDDESSNPRKCSEVADGVARESEGIAQLSFLCSVRQGVPEGRSGLCLRMLPSQWWSSGSRWSEVRGHRSVWSRTMVGRTGARAEESNLSTVTRTACLYTQAGREAAAVRSTRHPGSDGGNGGSFGPRTYLRGRPAAGTVRLSARPQRVGRRETGSQADLFPPSRNC